MRKPLSFVLLALFAASGQTAGPRTKFPSGFIGKWADTKKSCHSSDDHEYIVVSTKGYDEGEGYVEFTKIHVVSMNKVKIESIINGERDTLSTSIWTLIDQGKRLAMHIFPKRGASKDDEFTATYWRCSAGMRR